MSHTTYVLSAIIFIVLVGLVSAPAQNQNEGQKPGFCGEFIGQIDFIQDRLLQLQQAMPGKNYNWRPADGVRSVGEVYMHAALANYYFIRANGQDLPKDINIDVKPQEWDKTATAKDEIHKILVRSFDNLLAAAKKISDADLEKKVQVFGMEMTLRNFMVSSLNHLHEHLGQAIAYARINGITPPWTAEREKQAN